MKSNLTLSDFATGFVKMLAAGLVGFSLAATIGCSNQAGTDAAGGSIETVSKSDWPLQEVQRSSDGRWSIYVDTETKCEYYCSNVAGGVLVPRMWDDGWVVYQGEIESLREDESIREEITQHVGSVVYPADQGASDEQ